MVRGTNSDLRSLSLAGICTLACILVISACSRPALGAERNQPPTAAGARFGEWAVSESQLAIVADRIRRATVDPDWPAGDAWKEPDGLDSEVARLLAAQERTAGSPLHGAFEEVKARDERDIDFARRYFDPLRVLAWAYCLPQSRYYQSEEVIEAVHRGFAYVRKHVYPGCPRPGNWWVWHKQMPDCLVDLLSLASQTLSKEERAYLISVLDDLLGKKTYAAAGYGYQKPALDALTRLKAGVLAGDLSQIRVGWESIEREVAPYLLEDDGAPLTTVIDRQNLGVNLPYVYEGYFAIAEWAWLTRDTKLQLSRETIAKLTRYVLDFARWNTFQGSENWWPSFCNYTVFDRARVPHALARMLAAVDRERAEALRSFADGRDPGPEGCRFWPKAETVIFRTPRHSSTLVMASKRRHRISYSYKNRFLGIGGKWYYGRDGLLVLAGSDPDETDPCLTFTLNWRRLSGVSQDEGSLFSSSQLQRHTEGYWQPEWVLCENPMAGAATLRGEDGVAGIEVSSGAMRARKSYFFLKDQEMIVALGSHIRGQGHVETTVHTIPVGQAEAEITVNGRRMALGPERPLDLKTPCWAHVDGRGYYFPIEGDVTVIVESREPDFSDAYPASEELCAGAPPQAFVSLVFRHGSDPTDAAYAFVYFLSAAVEEMPQLVQSFADRAGHARTETGHRFSYGPYEGLVFFRPGRLGGYEANRPCFLLRKAGGPTTNIAVYEPSWEACRLQIAWAHPISGGQVTEGCSLNGQSLAFDVTPGTPIECELTEEAGSHAAGNRSTGDMD